MELNHTGYVDLTDFGEVRWRLENSRTPGMGLLFTLSREVLLEVARLLCEPGARSLVARQHRLQFLFERGLIKLAAEPGDDETPGTVNFWALSDALPCQVIYLPQVYLVYLPCLGRFPVPSDLGRPVSLSRPSPTHLVSGGNQHPHRWLVLLHRSQWTNHPTRFYRLVTP